MNLETLLEAAQFLEWSGPTKARAGKGGAMNNNSHVDKPNKDDDDDSPGRKEQRRAGGGCTREVHNKLEKNRRAHLKECFDMLKNQLPNMEDRKSSNLSILRTSLRYIQALKRKEKEYDQEIKRLTAERLAAQERIEKLKEGLRTMNVEVDLENFMPKDDQESHSTSTASEAGNPGSDDEEGLIKVAFVNQKIPIKMANNKTKQQTVTQLQIEASPVPIEKGLCISQPSVSVTSTISQILASRSTVPIAPAVPTITVSTQQPVKTQVAQRLQQTITQRALQNQQQQQQQQAISGPHPIQPVINIPSGLLSSMRLPALTVPKVMIPTSTKQDLPCTVTQTSTQAKPTTVVQLVTTGKPGCTTTSIPSVTTLSAVKQILAPTAQIITPGGPLSAISQMVSQAIGRQNTVTTVLPAASVSQLMAHSNNPAITMTPVTQIVTPVNMQVSPANLNQVVNPSILKNIGHLPLIPQQFLQPAQMVAGKPVVMVTLPTVPSTADITTPTIVTASIPTTSTVQVTVAVPRTSS